MNTLLYISGFVAVLSTLMVITRTNAVHALLYLIVSLLSVSLVFFLLGAPFAAALEVIVYAGAIMVLFVFVIMMLNAGADAAKQERQWLSPAGWIGPACLSAVLLGELVVCVVRKQRKNNRGRHGEPKAGRHLPFRPLPHRSGAGLHPPAVRTHRGLSSRPAG